MDELYRDAAADDEVSAAFTFDDNTLKRALKHIYEKDFHPMTEIEESLFNETFRIFTEATDEGISEVPAENRLEQRCILRFQSTPHAKRYCHTTLRFEW